MPARPCGPSRHPPRGFAPRPSASPQELRAKRERQTKARLRRAGLQRSLPYPRSKRLRPSARGRPDLARKRATLRALRPGKSRPARPTGAPAAQPGAFRAGVTPKTSCDFLKTKSSGGRGSRLDRNDLFRAQKRARLRFYPSADPQPWGAEKNAAKRGSIRDGRRPPEAHLIDEENPLGQRRRPVHARRLVVFRGPARCLPILIGLFIRLFVSLFVL